MIQQTVAGYAVLFLLLTSLGQVPSPQSREYENQVYRNVSVERRQKLKDRLELLVAYQIRQQWSRQYDLFSSLRRRAEGKADFINLVRKEYANGWKLPLVSFTPRSINLVQMDRTTKIWMIAGCAEVKEKNGIRQRAALIEAQWERNNWYFSEVQITNARVQGVCVTPIVEPTPGYGS
ncbi:MAG: hypothetical protein LC775_04305 [Acidobacteria bacterium]|nr:hypothetical protein [Acidobacteriota bacterium]